MDVRQLIPIFCQIDDFCKKFNHYYNHYLLAGPAKGKRGSQCGLALSEIMTILVNRSGIVGDLKL